MKFHAEKSISYRRDTQAKFTKIVEVYMGLLEDQLQPTMPFFHTENPSFSVTPVKPCKPINHHPHIHSLNSSCSEQETAKA
jgi:hypothetical protein